MEHLLTIQLLMMALVAVASLLRMLRDKILIWGMVGLLVTLGSLALAGLALPIPPYLLTLSSIVGMALMVWDMRD